MRLNKFLSHSGIASRRKADELIFQGKIKVNNEIINHPSYKIDPQKDKVYLNGNLITLKKKIYIALYKPKFVLCTLKDDFNRKIIIDLIKDIQERIYPVGRLDYDTKGIILLTNDGELANRLIHPRYKVPKEYIVKAKGIIGDKKLKLLQRGIIIDGKKTLPSKCKLIKVEKGVSIVKIILKEGRKRQVKKMFAHIGHPVFELERIKFGPISIDGLKEGKWRYLTKEEITKLYNLTGLTTDYINFTISSAHSNDFL